MKGAMMRKGNRVRIKESGKEGFINYVRMTPPTYNEVAAVSVLLDEKLSRPGYEGSMFVAEKVEVIE